MKNHGLALLLGLSLGAPAFSSVTEPVPDCTALLQRIQKGDFNTHRDLSSYERIFGRAFKADLDALGPDDAWLDAGSGDTIAMTEYMSAKKAPAKGIAVTFTAPNSKLSHIKTLRALQEKGRINLITGTYFEDIPAHTLGSPKLITDLFGIASYARALDVVLNRYLDILAPEGSIYLYSNKSSTKIQTSNGKKMNFLEYLRSIPGIKILAQPGPFWSESMPVRIQKTRGFKSGSVPPLKLLKMDDDAPPIRLYRMETVH